jgi:prophage regulatory protein
MAQQILKISEVSEQYKLSISTIYRLSAKGEFPKIFKLGERSSGVLKAEVDQWLQERIEVSRNNSEVV